MKDECARKVRQMIGSVSIKKELAFWKQKAESLKGSARGTRHSKTAVA